jgi:hypothetical protein
MVFPESVINERFAGEGFGGGGEVIGQGAP